MDTFLDLADVFGGFNPILLIPVIIVVAGVVSVFFFGLKKAESPQFRKTAIESRHLGGNAGSKRKKRNLVGGEVSHTQYPTAVTDMASSRPTLSKQSTNTSPPPPMAGPVKSSRAKETKSNTGAPSKKQPAKIATSSSVKTKSSQRSKPMTDLNCNNDGEGKWHVVVTKKQKKQTDAAAQTFEPLNSANENGKNVRADATGSSSSKSDRKNTSNKHKVTTGYPETTVNKAENSEENQQPTPSALQEHQILTTGTFSTPTVTKPPKSTEAPSLVFDELGEATWIDSKPLKRNKKRVLRE